MGWVKRFKAIETGKKAIGKIIFVMALESYKLIKEKFKLAILRKTVWTATVDSSTTT